MKVKELVEILNTYNPELPVVVETIVNNTDIDHVKPSIDFDWRIPGVVIYPQNQ